MKQRFYPVFAVGLPLVKKLQSNKIKKKNIKRVYHVVTKQIREKSAFL